MTVVTAIALQTPTMIDLTLWFLLSSARAQTRIFWNETIHSWGPYGSRCHRHRRPHSCGFK